jgi:hypothetical protein
MSLQDHISDEELEKFYLGLVPGQDELDRIEIHIRICSLCSLKADWTQDYVRTMEQPLRLLHGADT